ncbi:hypothetical protein DFH11DRAFT_1571413 [Phellopilus nigrolimitatus]|nr:hypothetical protein DFH11DRAFT_1571413 [Phellopilus nigrolimitatus]
MGSANDAIGNPGNSTGVGDTELPVYTADAVSANGSGSSDLRTEHTYSLNNAKGKPWLTLRVHSRSPSGKTLPVFLDGDEIRGEVRIELEKPEGCKGVLIGVLAENTAVGQEAVPFLDLTSPLWTPSSSSKLPAGSLTWPFSLTLPKEALVSASSKEAPKCYPLPPTFSERASPAYIDYKVTVTVKRGAFRVNQTLSTSFAYVPRWVAPAPSALRRLAYSDGSPLIGPEADPEGWHVLPPVKVTGTLFDAKSVEVEAILALASPLSYANGSPIPLLLTLKSSDAQALDLVAQPSASAIFLTRTIAIGSTATDETSPRRSNNTYTFPEHIARAFWWPVSEGAFSKDTRILQGEIDVKKDVKPGFVFPRLSIRYHISLFPFTASCFVPSAPADQLLLSEKVEIVTENAPGVVPRSHAPPGYTKPEEGNYNNSMGYLENGNQRFYHHHGFA